MKIIINSPSLDPRDNVSGISSVTRFIIENNWESDYRFFLLGRRDNERQGLNRVVALWKCYRRWKVMLAMYPDAVIHYNLPLSLGSLIRDPWFLRYALRKHGQVMVHVHGGYFLTATHIALPFRKILKWIFRQDVPFIVLGETERKTLQQRFGARRVKVLPNCVDLFDAQSFAQEALPHDENKPLRIGYLGRIEPRKGMNELLEACCRLKQEGVDFRLVLAGKEDTEGQCLPHFWQRLGDKFEYAGLVSGETKCQFLRSLDVFALPTYFEGLPMSLLETMSYGAVPVITPVGSIPQVVTDGKNGIFVKVRDVDSIVEAVKHLDTHRDDLLRMSEEARDTIFSNFSPARYVQTLNGVYNELFQVALTKYAPDSRYFTSLRTTIYYRFIRFSLGLESAVDILDGASLAGFDWKAFYEFSLRQTMLGLVFDGIQQLAKEASPPMPLLMQWIGVSEQLKRQNVLLDKASAFIYRKITAAGYRCCILKGQGNAVLYPNPLARTPGDVDVWVVASREELRHIATMLATDRGTIGKESLNHIEMTVNGVAVELHSTPAIMSNFKYNKRLQQWINEQADRQCSHMITLAYDPRPVAVPTAAFNAVYQLFHLFHHFFYEGVGLRQVVDYYYVVEQFFTEAEDEKALSTLQHTLRYLGLWKFAGAMMYVLQEVLAMPRERMIVPPDNRRGWMLLEEILMGGNFGQFDERHVWGKSAKDRNRFREGTFGHNMLRLMRDLRLMRYYPAEAFGEPVFRMWHFVWRLFKTKK